MNDSKLPAWPEAPFTNTLDSDYELAWSMFYRRNADAYRARMEALVSFIAANRHAIRAPMTVAERETMDALLAACERGES